MFDNCVLHIFLYSWNACTLLIVFGFLKIVTADTLSHPLIKVLNTNFWTNSSFLHFPARVCYQHDSSLIHTSHLVSLHLVSLSFQRCVWSAYQTGPCWGSCAGWTIHTKAHLPEAVFSHSWAVRSSPPVAHRIMSVFREAQLFIWYQWQCVLLSLWALLQTKTSKIYSPNTTIQCNTYNTGAM